MHILLLRERGNIEWGNILQCVMFKSLCIWVKHQSLNPLKLFKYSSQVLNNFGASDFFFFFSLWKCLLSPSLQTEHRELQSELAQKEGCVTNTCPSGSRFLSIQVLMQQESGIRETLCLIGSLDQETLLGKLGQAANPVRPVGAAEVSLFSLNSPPDTPSWEATFSYHRKPKRAL